ncbi:phosphoglucosamine mutase [Spirochaetota bacterium]
MPSSLMMSVSGIRGIVGETLTPDLINRVGKAFSKFVKKGTVVVGRDSRPTGGVILSGIKSSLALSGCTVIDLGIVPTPTVQLMVELLHAEGGIVISASHNPIEWNAFKLINSLGTFLTSTQINRFFKYLDEKPSYVKWDNVGTVSVNDSAGDMHIKKILEVVDADKIRECGFTVALDSVNGAGSLITQELLSELKCRILPIHCEMNGEFPRGAEPVQKNLKDLSTAVVKYHADIGFAQDPDADRLAIVDEKGHAIGEEYTIVLVAHHLLASQQGRVVVNLSTTKAVEDIAKKYNVPFTRTKVGEINVVEEMIKKGARIGGEGNGGIISPEVHLGRDSLVGIAYILEMMAERKKALSEIMSQMPRYVMKKGKVKIDAKKINSRKLGVISKKFKDEKVSLADGLRIDFKSHAEFSGGWVHLRSSNTEPIFRIIAEGKNSKQASAIYSSFSNLLK